MKALFLLLFVVLFINTACHENEVITPKTSTCIEAKVNAMRTDNVANTSVKRYLKNNEYYWLFDNGSAFDAPKYMLNVSCDTICKWCRCSSNSACQIEFDLGDTTAIFIWHY